MTDYRGGDWAITWAYPVHVPTEPLRFQRPVLLATEQIDAYRTRSRVVGWLLEQGSLPALADGAHRGGWGRSSGPSERDDRDDGGRQRGPPSHTLTAPTAISSDYIATCETYQPTSRLT
jgi:hypothetical protein